MLPPGGAVPTTHPASGLAHGGGAQGSHVPTTADIEALMERGRGGQALDALAEVDALLPALHPHEHGEVLLAALYCRAHVQRIAEVPLPELLTTADALEQTAVEQRQDVWAATARALRAVVRLESGEAGAAMGDLARIDLDQLTVEPGDLGGFCLLDTAAAAFSRLRLHDQAEQARFRLEGMIAHRSRSDRATHGSRWAVELAARALEPVASGADRPDERLLAAAVTVAERTAAMSADGVPDAVLKPARAVLALGAAWRGEGAQALQLLGGECPAHPTAIGTGLRAYTRQLTTLATMRAHALLGEFDHARHCDDHAHPPAAAALPNLVLEVCRVRERLRIERAAGGDPVPVLLRLSELLVRLGWQGMGLVSETARHALEHQVLRNESRTDPLTGAGNRRALDEDLRHMLRFSPLPLAMVLVDVDDFKQVNDRHTHVVGDEVLRRVAGALGRGLRTGDRLVRYGGDEFVVLLPRTGDQDARLVAGRMAQAVRELPWAELADGLRIEVTTGSAAIWSLTSRRPDGDAAQLFRRADEALLEAKRRRVGAAEDAVVTVDIRDGRRTSDLRVIEAAPVTPADPLPVLEDPAPVPRPEPGPDPELGLPPEPAPGPAPLLPVAEPGPQPEPTAAQAPAPQTRRSRRLAAIIDLTAGSTHAAGRSAEPGS